MQEHVAWGSFPQSYQWQKVPQSTRNHPICLTGETGETEHCVFVCVWCVSE